MVNIKKMKSSEWNRLKEDLESQLKEAGWRFSRIMRTGETTIAIEGGSIPIHYNIESNECAVWNKCSRYSKGFVQIEMLVEVSDILDGWGAEVCRYSNQL